MSRKNSILFIILGVIFFTAGGFLLERSTMFTPMKKVMQSQSVPSALLNYGTFGKILKQLGVVMAIPKDHSRSPASPAIQLDKNAPIFQKKRQLGNFLYMINPGGEKEIPSSLIIKKDQHQEKLPLLSVTTDENNLYHPETGIITNYKRRGRNWEQLAYVSYFEKGNVRFATAAGLRLHGGYFRNPPKRGEKRNYSFRLYFRDEYGVNQFRPGLLFDADCEPVKHLVVHSVASWQVRYTPCIAFDIARRIGCKVPQTRLTQFFLNGKPQGYYYLSEHLNKTQWVSHIGHDNFAFYRSRGGGDKGTMGDYKELIARVRNPRIKMTVKEVGKYVDIDNLSRHLFSWMFCGTTDQCQGAAVLDRNKPGARWYWINWDMDQSFLNSQLRNPRLKHWQQRALPLAMSSVKNWKVGCLRQVLFTRLLMDNSEYREYFVRLTMDLLNHRLAPDFLNFLIDSYQELPIPHGSGKPYTEEKSRVKNDLGRLREYMEHRPNFLRKEIQNHFSTGEILKCRIKCIPAYRYEIDGFPEKGNYRGQYFKGKTINIKLVGPKEAAFSHWLVNGKKYTDKILIFSVTRDTIISPVLKNETLLLEAVKRGDIGNIREIMKERWYSCSSPEEKKQLTFLAMIEAVERGYGEIVSVLVNNGADVNIEVDKNISLLIRALALNHLEVVKTLKSAGAVFSLEQIKKSKELLSRFFEIKLKSSECTELDVWNKNGSTITDISPSLLQFSKKGIYKFTVSRDKGKNIIIVRNTTSKKNEKNRIQFGYEFNRRSLNKKIPRGKYVHFVVSADISPNLMNKNNYLFISDYKKGWESSKTFFSSSSWQTYLVSKKVRSTCRRLIMAFRFSPQSQKDRLKIRGVRIFISEKPLYW